MATYNSSHLLSYSVQSILNSDFKDWELIIIGDCCTDDTEECVNGFKDSRIRFHNLETNSGQQAKPNNVGLSMAKGEYIAFLNQDDIYYSSHLSKSLEEIQRFNADMVIAPGLVIESFSNVESEVRFNVRIDGAHAINKFSANIFSVASTWFMKRSLIETVGPWNMEREVYWSPSQEWLLRAYKKGVKMHFSDRIGLIIIYSGSRKSSYVKKQSPEHDYFFNKMTDLDFQRNLMEKAALSATYNLNDFLYYNPSKQIKRLGGYLVDSIAHIFGKHPVSFKLFLSGKRKGNLLKRIRKYTGL